MRILARIAVCFFLLTFSFLSLAPYAHAQLNPVSSLMKTDGNIQTNVVTLTQGIFFGMLSTATCAVGGVDYFSPNLKCLEYNARTGTFGYAKDLGGGLLGLETSGISMLYTSPLHTSDYLQYMASNFGVVKNADAATVADGFGQLTPLMKLWVAFRNLAYLFYVVIFVGIGFAIMIRAKIDPRTVMTIENQIPKLIVSLILITFSFAIAGLVIDLMWVSVYFILNIFGQLDPEIGKQLGSLTGNIYNMPLSWINNIEGTGGFLGLAGQASGGVFQVAQTSLYAIFQKVVWLKVILVIIEFPIVIPCAISAVVHGVTFGIGGQDFGTCLDTILSGEFAGIMTGIAFLVFAIAILAALFKLWWRLLKCFALFHVYVIFGPLMVMAGFLPGSKINFENWLRHLIAYTAVFPTTIAVFLLGKTLMDLYTNSPGGFSPPLIGASPQTSGMLGPLLGFAVIMLAPSTTAMVQEALSAPDFKFLPEIGAGIAAGGSMLSGGFGKAVVDPLWREANIATGQRAGYLREALQGGAVNPRTPPVLRGLAKWFGYTREHQGK